MRRSLCAAALLTRAPVTACSAPSEMADLAGTYVLSFQTDTLRLDSLGRYTRVYVQIGTPGLVAIDSGRWRLSKNRRLVALDGLPQRWPEHGRLDGGIVGFFRTKEVSYVTCRALRRTALLE